jgi:signal transduction histidine kinase
MIDVIGAEAERLEQLAKEFTALGRLPEGPPAEVDLEELLDELTRTSVPGTITARLTRSLGRRTILGHYDPLRRALGNILRNACEAMNGAGMLDLAVIDSGGGVQVEIADHGPGIPADLKPRIFEPYFTSKSDGTGLGLTLVRQTIEAHGGTIAVADTPGGGATFRIWLPARTAALSGAHSLRSAQAPARPVDPT